MNIDRIAVGKRLRIIRGAFGGRDRYAKDYAETVAQCGKTTYSNYEKGTSFDIEAIVRIYRKTGYDLHYILFGEMQFLTEAKRRELLDYLAVNPESNHEGPSRRGRKPGIGKLRQPKGILQDRRTAGKRSTV